jgi:hypothetical protein
VEICGKRPHTPSIRPERGTKRQRSVRTSTHLASAGALASDPNLGSAEVCPWCSLRPLDALGPHARINDAGPKVTDVTAHQACRYVRAGHIGASGNPLPTFLVTTLRLRRSGKDQGCCRCEHHAQVNHSGHVPLPFSRPRLASQREPGMQAGQVPGPPLRAVPFPRGSGGAPFSSSLPFLEPEPSARLSSRHPRSREYPPQVTPQPLQTQ